MIRITPKHKDKKVINPETMKRVSEKGILIQKLNTYWRNRFNDGDINVKDLSKKVKPKQISKDEEKGK